MFQTNHKQRFVLVNVVEPVVNHEAALFDLEELKSLVLTFGGATIVRIIQRRNRPDPSTYIGSGKLQELLEIVQKEKIEVVVLNGVLKTSQIFKLEKALWAANPNIKVWDRVDLILNIFDKHAATREAKLQIELARMHHMGPSIYGLGGTVLSRQRGGIGQRGIGQTNIELMKRHFRTQIKKIQDEILKIEEMHAKQVRRRKELGLKTVSIIGYTNAGKTSLFNYLTGKNKVAQNVLFATLDSTVGKIYLPNLKREVLVSDTIGFIQNLPINLIRAFKSTLMESLHADLLLHVIDISDVLMIEKIEVVENVLDELGIKQKEQIYVFNKTDSSKFNQEEINSLYSHYRPLFISVKDNTGLQKLEDTLEGFL